MRTTVPTTLERGRRTLGPMASSASWGMIGAFQIHGPCGADLTILVSNGTDWPFPPPAWEHVSVSCRHRTPNWREMEFVRDLCWLPTEWVVQFSVPRAEHINVHAYCLHWWRPIGLDIPTPPAECVGPPVAQAAP